MGKKINIFLYSPPHPTWGGGVEERGLGGEKLKVTKRQVLTIISGMQLS